MNAKLESATNLYMEGIRDGHARQAVTKYMVKSWGKYTE